MTSPPPVRFGEALRFWTKLGFISFGGPAGQIAIMHEELVDRRRWISERRFLHALNYCMVLPGPEAQQLATYIGWLLHGTWGGIAAGALFVLPSLALLILLSWIYVAFGHLPAVAALLYGVKPAVVAIVVHALHRIGSRTLKNAWLWSIAAGSFVALFLFSVPFPAIVLIAALVGVAGGRARPGHFALTQRHSSGVSTGATAMIDDDTPTPPHARFSVVRVVRAGACGLLLWAVPMGLLDASLGWAHTLTTMGWFFTKAALVTFGGAYAVLPYVYQGAVDHHGWLTASQMIDGLALGETTPGPLIMVVTFVGFVGGYGHAIFGPDALLSAGVAAAVVVTWFTFLPSFVFILAGGPLVESTRGELAYTAPLTAITAAVVGVILSLALLFGYHVLWPDGFDGRFELWSALLTMAGAWMLIRRKWSVMRLIGASAAAGLLIRAIAAIG